MIAWQRPCSDAVVDLLLWLLRGQREGRGGEGGEKRTKRRTRGRINMKKRRFEKE